MSSLGEFIADVITNVSIVEAARSTNGKFFVGVGLITILSSTALILHYSSQQPTSASDFETREISFTGVTRHSGRGDDIIIRSNEGDYTLPLKFLPDGTIPDAAVEALNKSTTASLLVDSSDSHEIMAISSRYFSMGPERAVDWENTNLKTAVNVGWIFLGCGSFLVVVPIVFNRRCDRA